jgi:lipopolysaccharide export system permease protein
VLSDVELFLLDPPQRDRIVAKSARLEAGKWELGDVTRYRTDAPAETLAHLTIATTTTRGDMQLEATSGVDLTLPELLSAVSARISDPTLRAVALTSLGRTISLPFMVAGSLLIGFAFAGRYRRIGTGSALLQGLAFGFVIYVANELAIRASNAGALSPMVATAGPALVSVLVGITALLFLEEGPG